MELKFNNIDVWGTFITGIIIAIAILIIRPYSLLLGIIVIILCYLYLYFRLITCHGIKEVEE